MDARTYLKEKGSLVGPVIEKYLSKGDAKMQEMLLHTAAAGGKRIRPALVLTACEAVGGNPESIISAAASVELLHTFTLVHDDIMDEDLVRRGKPTVHALWGLNMGIVVGDALYAKAFESIVDVRKNGIPEGRVLDALEAFNHANAEVHEGQIMDMGFEERDDVSEEEYLVMIEKKTGALIEGSLKIGAILGGGSDEQIQSLSKYGVDVGLAFQIKDDLLDLTAEEEKLGKPLGSDIIQGKKSLIIVHALANADELQKKLIKDCLGRECGKEEVGRVIKTLYETGSIHYAEEKLGRLVDEAKGALKVIPDGQAREVLEGLADFIIERKH